MKFIQETLDYNKNTLAEYTKWLTTNEVYRLPSSVMSVLVRGQRDLEDSIKAHEKMLDESIEEEYLHFSDEDFLVDDIGLEDMRSEEYVSSFDLHIGEGV